MGIKFSLACTHLLPFGSLPLSSRHFTPSLSLPSPLLPSRRLDKGTFSVGQQGKGGWKGARSDAPIDVSLTLVGMSVPSSLHPSLHTFFHLCYQPEFAFPLFLSFSLLTVSFYLSIWYCRLLAARKGSRARGKPAVKLKHDEGSRLRCEGERRGERAKKKERRRRRRQSDTRRRRRH